MEILVRIIEALIPIVAILVVIGLPIVGFFVLKWRKMTLEHKESGGLSKKTGNKIDLLIEQNEELKEEVEQMKFLLGIGKKESKSLDIERYRQQNEKLTDYEKEQIRIDNQNKFDY